MQIATQDATQPSQYTREDVGDAEKPCRGHASQMQAEVKIGTSSIKFAQFLQMKDDRVAATLLLVIIDILTLPPASMAAPTAAGRAADALAASIIAKRIKALYFLLGSDHKGRVNASLALMTALVRRGVARDLVRGFDFDVPAFGRAARAPRCACGDLS